MHRGPDAAARTLPARRARSLPSARLVGRRRPRRSCTAPHAETAVRSASIGLAVFGSARSAWRTGVGMAAGELRVRVPLAGPQQVARRSRVRAVADEVADRVAAVQQAPALAVDERQGGLAGDDTLEAQTRMDRRCRAGSLMRTMVARRTGPRRGPYRPGRGRTSLAWARGVPSATSSGEERLEEGDEPAVAVMGGGGRLR